MAVTPQQLLDACEQAILDLLTHRVASATVNGQTFTALDLDRLRKIRDDLRAEVVREYEEAQDWMPGTSRIRFEKP